MDSSFQFSSNLMDENVEEEEGKEPDYEAENAEANLQFFKSHLNSINKKIHQNREKIVYLRKVYQQFAMLINKTVGENYGVIEKPVKIEKPLPISLPPSNPSMSDQLLHLLMKTDAVTPSDVAKFVNNFPIVESLIFTNQSAFDDKLLNALFRSSPDIRISFFNTVSAKLLRCNKFLTDLLPTLSRLSLHPALRKQNTDPYAQYDDFFKFFEDSKKQIGELLGFKDIIILFATNDGDLLYPTKDFDHLISINNTLLGDLLHAEGPAITKTPLDDPRIRRPEERCVFQSNSALMSCRFSFENKVEHGLVLAFNEDGFSEADLTNMQIVVQYTSPALHLISNIFNEMYPAAIADVLLKISELYEADDPIEMTQEIITELGNAQTTKLFVLKKSEEFPDIPVLPEGQSLIRNAIESGKPQSIRLPRLKKEFSKQVDDDQTMSIITAFYITQIKCENLVAVVYNCNRSNGFPPKQRQLIENFTKSIPTVVSAFLNKRHLENSSTHSSAQGDMIEKFLALTPRIMRSVQDLQLFEEIEKQFNGKLKFEFYSTVENNTFFVFPKNDTEEMPEEFHLIKQSTFLVIGDKKKFVVPRKTDFLVFIVVSPNEEVINQAPKSIPESPSKQSAQFSRSSSRVSVKRQQLKPENKDPFQEFDIQFITLMSDICITLFPWYLMETQINDLINRQSYVRSASRMSIDSIANLIDYDLVLETFDDSPKTEADIEKFKHEKAFVLPIETNKGIEAVISCETPIEDELSISVLDSYKKWLTVALSLRVLCKEIPQEVMDLFNVIKLRESFTIDEKRLMIWVTNILTIFMTNKYNYNENIKNSKFVYEFIEKVQQKTWFTEQEKTIMALIVFLDELEKFWRIKTDDYLIDLCKSVNCSVHSPPIIASLFNSKFGLFSDKIPTPQVNSSRSQESGGETTVKIPEEWKQIAKTIDLFKAGSRIENQIEVIANLRRISDEDFVNNDDNKKWLGRSLVLLKAMRLWVGDGISLASLTKENPSIVIRKETTYADRIMLPITTYLSMKNEFMLDLLRHIRTNLRNVKLESR